MAWLYIIAFHSITVKLVAMVAGLFKIEVILDRKYCSEKSNMLIGLHTPVNLSRRIGIIETTVYDC